MFSFDLSEQDAALIINYRLLIKLVLFAFTYILGSHLKKQNPKINADILIFIAQKIIIDAISYNMQYF